MRVLAELLLEVVAVALIATGLGMLVASASGQDGAGVLIAGLVLLFPVWVAAGAPRPRRNRTETE